MAELPDSVRAKAQLTPVEDVLLAILDLKLPEVDHSTLITMPQEFPFVHIRRLDSFGVWAGDPRFLDDAYVGVYTFAEGPDGDEDAAILGEAVRVCFFEAHQQRLVLPGKGSVVSITMAASPRRVSDWATATGPVQFADLPAGVWRYESRYNVTVRRPL